MTKRGSATDFILTQRQFLDLLETAAAIEDREKSIECFAYIVMMGRHGLRAGELIHYGSHWVDPELPGIRIPSFEGCDCGYCRTAAKRRLEEGETEENLEALIEEYWSPKSTNGARPVVLETERARKALKRHQEHWANVGISYSTIAG